MPVGTAATVKGLTPEQLLDAGVQMVLANTYHLALRPGADVIEELGGLHRVMGWNGPILTDSGGFQVFSLAKLTEIDEEQVVFRSHLDGSPFALSPEKAVRIQEALGADCIMCLDECPPHGVGRERLEAAVDRTTRWAARSREAQRRGDQALFGIVQGGPTRTCENVPRRDCCLSVSPVMRSAGLVWVSRRLRCMPRSISPSPCCRPTNRVT